VAVKPWEIGGGMLHRNIFLLKCRSAMINCALQQTEEYIRND
jgi:hypothetical protein